MSQREAKVVEEPARYIDVDGHILEPGGIWEEYIEPKYRDRALKILKDDKGLEYLSIDGKPSPGVARCAQIGTSSSPAPRTTKIGRKSSDGATSTIRTQPTWSTVTPSAYR